MRMRRMGVPGLWSPVLIAAALTVAGHTPNLAAEAEPTGKAQAPAAKTTLPRFFVPDFWSGDGKEETQWVALAVSEGLRDRLRRSGATRAISGMRTAGVMERFAKQDKPDPRQALTRGTQLGADWVAMGTIRIDDKGQFAAEIRICPTAQAAKEARKSIHAPSMRVLLDQTTDAVLDLTGVKLTEAQRKVYLTAPGESDSALEYYAKAVRAVRARKPQDALYYVAQSRRYDSNFRPTLKLLGQINIAAGNFAEVLMIFERLLRQAKRDGDTVDTVFAMTQIAISHQRQRELAIAEKYYNAAMEEARQAGLDDLETILLGAIATLRVDEQKPDEALRLLGDRLRRLEAQGDRLAMGPACLTIALIYAAKKDNEQAIQFLDAAVKLADEVDVPSDKAAALYQKGQLYVEAGRLDDALKAYRESIDCSEEGETGSAYREIAGVYEKKGQLDEAMKMLRKAEAILSRREAYAQQANCLTRISRIYAKQKQDKSAVKAMTEAVEILRDLGHPELAKYEKELDDLRGKSGSP
ncbi:MAG: tetratricopeptide repeat protein [Phycisphaerae bacterium]|nr:tetratricopeptide repeat protein [Phycisphaerae bacterium]